MIELWNVRPRKSPQEILLELSQDCERLSVNTSDVYGDFDATAQTSYLRRFEREISDAFGKEDVRLLLAIMLFAIF